MTVPAWLWRHHFSFFLFYSFLFQCLINEMKKLRACRTAYTRVTVAHVVFRQREKKLHHFTSSTHFGILLSRDFSFWSHRRVSSGPRSTPAVPLSIPVQAHTDGRTPGLGNSKQGVFGSVRYGGSFHQHITYIELGSAIRSSATGAPAPATSPAPPASRLCRKERKRTKRIQGGAIRLSYAAVALKMAPLPSSRSLAGRRRRANARPLSGRGRLWGWSSPSKCGDRQNHLWPLRLRSRSRGPVGRLFDREWNWPYMPRFRELWINTKKVCVFDL